LLGALAIAAIAFLLTVYKSAAGHKKPDIILITAASLRPDHLSCYGYAHIDTPAIDSLSSGGFLYRNAYCNTPHTLFSLCSIFTGRYGYEVISQKGDSLSINASTKTMPELLSENGYATGAVSASGFPFADNNLFRKGFDLFESAAGAAQNENLPALVTDKGIKIARELKNKGDPVFIWLEYPIPNYPYKVPDDFPAGKRDFAYDRQILFLDSEIGRLLSGLKDAGYKDALFIFTAENGEGLDEHNEPLHGVFLYQSTVKVPLIIKMPSGRGAKQLDPVVTLADIAPTVLSAAHIEYDKEGFKGADLMGSFSRKKQADRPLYLETLIGYSDYGWSPLAGFMEDGYKYIESPKPALYNVRDDPYELRNLRYEDGQRAMQMQSRLFKYLEESRPETLKIINKGAAPQDKTWVLKLYLNERASSIKAAPDAQIKFYKKLLSKDPGNKQVIFALAELFTLLKKPHMSEYYLEDLVKRYPDSSRGWELLGTAYSDQGKYQEAIAAYKKELSLLPDSVIPLNNLAWALAKTKTSLDEALVCAKRANELAPDAPLILDTLAEVYSAKGEKEKAAETLKRAVALDPQSEYLNSRLKEIQSGS